jgi:hypothetical protein
MPEMLPTEQEAALALVTANGNTNLATERLQRNFPSLTSEKLLILLSSSDLSRLNMQIKATLAIRSFTLLNKLQDCLEASIPDMEPKDMAKAYTSLLNALPALLPSQQPPQKPITPEDILNSLPAEVREAYEAEIGNT